MTFSLSFFYPSSGTLSYCRFWYLIWVLNCWIEPSGLRRQLSSSWRKQIACSYLFFDVGVETLGFLSQGSSFLIVIGTATAAANWKRGLHDLISLLNGSYRFVFFAVFETMTLFSKGGLEYVVERI